MHPHFVITSKKLKLRFFCYFFRCFLVLAAKLTPENQCFMTF